MGLEAEEEEAEAAEEAVAEEAEAARHRCPRRRGTSTDRHRRAPPSRSKAVELPAENRRAARSSPVEEFQQRADPGTPNYGRSPATTMLPSELTAG